MSHVAFWIFFCGCRGFCHRTESDLFLFSCQAGSPYLVSPSTRGHVKVSSPNTGSFILFNQFLLARAGGGECHLSRKMSRTPTSALQVITTSGVYELLQGGWFRHDGFVLSRSSIEEAGVTMLLTLGI